MILGIKINGELLRLSDSTELNLIIVNPFFEIEKVLCSPYTFDFSIPDDGDGHNRRLLAFNDSIACRNQLSEIACTLCLANNDWMSGTLTVEWDNGKFSCYFVQLLDVSAELDESLRTVPLPYIATNIDEDLGGGGADVFYSAIKDRIDIEFETKDFVLFPIKNYNFFDTEDDFYNGTYNTHISDTNDNYLSYAYFGYLNYWYYLEDLVEGEFYMPTGAEENPTYTEYALSPAIYVKYILETIFEDLGYEFNGDSFFDNDMQNLVIYSNWWFKMTVQQYYSQTDPEHLWFTSNEIDKTTFNLKAYLPDVLIKLFLQAVKKSFCLTYFYDILKRRIRIIPNKNIISSTETIDWTSKVIKGYNKGRNETDGYILKPTYSDDEIYDTRPVLQITNYGSTTSVPTFANLPLADSVQNQVYLVEEIDKYFLSRLTGGVYDWVLLSENYLDYQIEGAETEIDLESDIVLSSYDSSAKKNEIPDWVDCYYNWGTSQDVKWVVPEANYLLDNNIDYLVNPPGGQTKEEFIRFLFYKGMMPYNLHWHDEGAIYPFATHDEKDNANNVIGAYSLQPDGNYGLYEIWWKPYINFLKNTVLVKYNCILNITDLLELDVSKKIFISDPHSGATISYIISKISIPIGKKIGVATIELYRL